MAKTLDFNKINRPVLQLVMPNEEKTMIRVTTPTQGLYEELQATTPELQKILAGGDKESVELCYELAAKLINCNRSFITVTPVELREKYGLELEYLLEFYVAYTDFIQEVFSAKN